MVVDVNDESEKKKSPEVERWNEKYNDLYEQKHR